MYFAELENYLQALDGKQSPGARDFVRERVEIYELDSPKVDYAMVVHFKTGKTTFTVFSGESSFNATGYYFFESNGQPTATRKMAYRNVDGCFLPSLVDIKLETLHGGLSSPQVFRRFDLVDVRLNRTISPIVFDHMKLGTSYAERLADEIENQLWIFDKRGQSTAVEDFVFDPEFNSESRSSNSMWIRYAFLVGIVLLFGVTLWVWRRRRLL